jgi:hypothetical protein
MLLHNVGNGVEPRRPHVSVFTDSIYRLTALICILKGRLIILLLVFGLCYSGAPCILNSVTVYFHLPFLP